MNKKFDTNKSTRDIKDQLYREWKKDPVAFKKNSKKEAARFKEEYIIWSKNKKAA